MNLDKALTILIYCPDRHILYDGRTPDEVGVGGGITARVRMSRALVRLGHSVLHVGHCPRPARIDGVDYLPLDEFRGVAVDVSVVTTSGGDLDLTPYLGLDVKTPITAVWVHGFEKPGGLDDIEFDRLFAVSKFIGGIARDSWGIPEDKIDITYNGYEPSHFEDENAIERDPYQLIYSSHPSKGLEPAMGVLEELRRRDSRYHLEVFGGEELWGGEKANREYPEGVNFHGMIGQKELAKQFTHSSFSLHIQNYPEPFGLSVIEAMSVGCIPICSEVGAFPELIRHRGNGLLITGNPSHKSTHREAERVIKDLTRKNILYKRISRAAKQTSISCDKESMHWIELIRDTQLTDRSIRSI